MSAWNLIDSKVFTEVKDYVKSKQKNLTDANFTSDDISEDNAVFPTIKIKVMSMKETGGDIEGSTVNAVDVKFQVDVVAKTPSQVDLIIQYALIAFKKMRFIISSMPISTHEGDIYRSMMRCERIVGSGDVL